MDQSSWEGMMQILKIGFLAIACLGLLRVASATPVCSTGTLAAYEALGSTGCNIGTVTVASFATLSGTNGATAINTGAVTVTPGGGTTDPELTFSFSLMATDPTLFESIFTYAIFGPDFTSDTITLSGSGETGNGGVSDIQNYCIGGSFGPDAVTGCNGSTSGTLLTLDGIQNTDTIPFASTSSLSITDDFVLDSGGPGTASGGTFADQYAATATSTSPVPEPGAFLLTATGLALSVFRKCRPLAEISNDPDKETCA
jgi:hypothetical protein